MDMNYESVKPPFQIGDWVKVIDKNDFLNGRNGFVEEHDFWNSRYRVIFTCDVNGKYSPGRSWVPEQFIISINDDRHKDDLSSLIDFALETKDEKWFRELSSKLPLQNW